MANPEFFLKKEWRIWEYGAQALDEVLEQSLCVAENRFIPLNLNRAAYVLDKSRLKF